MSGSKPPARRRSRGHPAGPPGGVLDLADRLRPLVEDVARFASHASGLRLRSYQQAAARAIVESVLYQKGLTFVVIFPRQSGKNELQAQIEAYLLTLFQRQPAEMVKVSPTWKPQSLNAMRRLERVLERNLLTRGRWKKEQGFIYRLGEARIYFLSAQPTANVVGATASALLECDEAQDVLLAKWDKEINPMAASSNATRVLWGTAWTSQTLLARERQAALEAEQRDGVRRLFELGADQVGAEVPAYARFVAGEIARLGRQHPYVRSQYFSEAVDAHSGMFPPGRLALLRGDHPALEGPTPGRAYVFCIDVGGEGPAGGEPGAGSPAPPGRSHDATALTVFEIDPAGLEDELLRAVRYRIVKRKQWLGLGQAHLYAKLSALLGVWQPQRVVIDATGVGEGLASFLERAAPRRVMRFIFSQASKSALGWRLLALVESGRLKDHRPPDDPRGEAAGLQGLFGRQCELCELSLLPGPGRLARWGVPDGRRDPLTGAPAHDDLLLSAALIGALDEQTAFGLGESAVIAAPDPLEALGW